jgi:hypothetical protein
MANIIAKINGNKTYIVAALAGVAAVAQALGYTVPEYVWTLLGAAGLGAVRHAVGK